MKIAFDYQIFCHQEYGGISRYFAQLAEQFDIMGDEAKIFAPYHRNNYIDNLPSQIVRGVNVGFYPPKTTRAALYVNRILSGRAIQKFRPDVVHETYFSQNGCSPTNSSVVITVYDMISELFTPNSDVVDKVISTKRSAIDRADHVICISESTRRDLINLFGIEKSKTSVVYLGCDQSSNILEDNGVPIIEQKYLLYVGKRGGYKNFDLFIRAAASSRHIAKDFAIIAFGGGKFNENELATSRDLGFKEGQVQQIGGDDGVLANLYRNANAFVYPSLYEGFGLPPLEAMSYGCAVVSSNSSSMPEVIGDAAEYFDPSSLEEIREALEAVLYSSERAEELKSLGGDRVKKFSWQRCAENTNLVYQMLSKPKL